MNQNKYIKYLLDISSEPLSLSYKEFSEYISEYVHNPKEFDIDVNSDYFKALEWAYDNLKEAYDFMINYKNPMTDDQRISMYKRLTEKFSEAMIKELDANHTKGDRDGDFGWMTMSNKQNLGELYYHVGKLQEAMRNNNIKEILEYSADISNLAMMVYDRYKPLIPYPTINEEKENKI